MPTTHPLLQKLHTYIQIYKSYKQNYKFYKSYQSYATNLQLAHLYMTIQLTLQTNYCAVWSRFAIDIMLCAAMFVGELVGFEFVLRSSEEGKGFEFPNAGRLHNYYCAFQQVL